MSNLTSRKERFLERLENARKFDFTGGFEPRFLANFVDQECELAKREERERVMQVIENYHYDLSAEGSESCDKCLAKQEIKALLSQDK